MALHGISWDLGDFMGFQYRILRDSGMEMSWMLLECHWISEKFHEIYLGFTEITIRFHEPHKSLMALIRDCMGLQWDLVWIS